MCESKFFCTIANQNRTTISKNEIPNKTTYLDLSRNQIEKLDNDFFENCPKLWNVNLSHNKLKTLSFAHDLAAIEVLDISYNNLSFDNLIDIFHIYVIQLKLQGNKFISKINNFLVLPAVLTHAWIINGIFITDYMRKQAKEFSESLSFGEEIMKLRKDQYTTSKQASISNSAHDFLNGTAVKFNEPGTYISRTGLLMKEYNEKPQINRLNLIMQLNPIELLNGTFTDYLGVSMGILSFFWMQIPVDLIPRTLCGNYWMVIVRQIEKIEQYQLVLLLMKISEVIEPEDEIRKSIWECLGVNYYLQTGEIPKSGSTPRLLLSAFLENSPDAPNTEDRILFNKLRKSAKIDPVDVEDINDRLFQQIYNEILAPLPSVACDQPKKGHTIALRHPFYPEKWVNATILSCKNGRVYSRLEHFIVQLPILSVYWDGRGVWREAVPTIDPKPIEEEEEEQNEDQMQNVDDTEKVQLNNTQNDITKINTTNKSCLPQIRAKSEIRQVEHDKGYRVGIYNPISSLRKTSSPGNYNRSNISVKKASTLGKSAINDVLSNTPLTAQKAIKASKSKKRTQSKLVDNQPTFVTDGSMQRGAVYGSPIIAGPLKPERKAVMMASPTRRPNMYIQDVINITFGQEMGNGKKLRKFNVRTENLLTHKSQYIWIAEDEISPEDVKRLVELFKKHIESKYTIIPGL